MLEVPPKAMDMTLILKADIHSWWQTESQDWDEAIAGESDLSEGNSLWDGMPEVDSKTVARSSPIFEEHLGIPLDIKQIRPGGYRDITDMLDDLVPKMVKLAQKKFKATIKEKSA